MDLGHAVSARLEHRPDPDYTEDFAASDPDLLQDSQDSGFVHPGLLCPVPGLAVDPHPLHSFVGSPQGRSPGACDHPLSGSENDTFNVRQTFPQCF